MNAIMLGERDDYMSKKPLPLDRFKRRYQDWLESNLNVEGVYDSFVSDTLFAIPYSYTIDEDAHRLADGLELRNQYSEMSGEILDERDANTPWPCSVLEVMASLAMSMEYNCDDSPTGGTDDVGYFYHEMLDNLGIGHEFPGSWESRERLIRKVIDKFLDRRYGKDGHGGLFPLRRPRKDQRDVELWYQMNAYMIENY